MPATKSTIGFTVEVIIEPDESSFHAYCPALKGLHATGDTEEEALRNAEDAVKAYIRSLIKHGDPIPVGVNMQSETDRDSSIDHGKRHSESVKVACSI